MNHYKKQLTDSLTDLTGIRRDLTMERPADFLDFIVAKEAHEVESRLASHDATRIREIRAALARLDDGSYGECIECAEPISAMRLNAAPWAARCIGCQEEFDQSQALEYREAA